MSRPTQEIIKFLQKLKDVDASLARFRADQEAIEKEKKARAVSYVSASKEVEDLQREVTLRRAKYNTEEKRLKEENDKLVERRKVLSSFGNYKVQQSAQKEIEQSAKQINAQEEKLLSTLEELEQIEKELEEKGGAYNELKSEYDKYLGDIEDELDTLLERAKEKEEERRTLTQEVDHNELTLYERIRKRYPMDPIVPLKGSNCGGCFMNLGPQVVVQVSRGEKLVKCKGCGRILFLEEQSAEQ